MTKEKSESQVLETVREQSFAEDIENDKQKSAIYMSRAAQAKSMLGDNDQIAKQEEMALGVYKRFLLLTAAGGLEVDDGTKTQSASVNNLPASSYIGHGGRMMIEIPQGSGDTLMNWLTSGNKETDGRSRKQDQLEALNENKIVYSRSAATHDVKITEKDGQFKLEEIKQKLPVEAKNWVAGKINNETKHWGVDLSMNAEFGKQDTQGNYVDRPDGDHGHLYMHYNPPTNERPGSLLIGIEGAAPSSSKHSILGTSEPLSATEGLKFSELTHKQKIAGEEEYKDTIIPKKFGGMIMKLDAAKLSMIVELNDKDYGLELASVIPGASPEQFKEKIAQKELHNTPEFKPSIKPIDDKKALEFYEKISLHDEQRTANLNYKNSLIRPTELTLDQRISYLQREEQRLKPNIIQEIINFITGGKAFSDRINRYEAVIENLSKLEIQRDGKPSQTKEERFGNMINEAAKNSGIDPSQIDPQIVKNAIDDKLANKINENERPKTVQQQLDNIVNTMTQDLKSITTKPDQKSPEASKTTNKEVLTRM